MTTHDAYNYCNNIDPRGTFTFDNILTGTINSYKGWSKVPVELKKCEINSFTIVNNHSVLFSVEVRK